MREMSKQHLDLTNCVSFQLLDDRSLERINAEIERIRQKLRQTDDRIEDLEGTFDTILYMLYVNLLRSHHILTISISLSRSAGH